MLTELRLRDLGVIEDTSVEFAPGLTVLTGETGAGKTMLVIGLVLLGGGRADAARVRTGADRAVVEGRIDPDGPTAARAVDAGGQLDEDGSLLLRRTVASRGRSRAQVGGAAAPVGVLGEIAGRLVTVHGQHESLRLLRPAEQRVALDRYGDAAGAGVGSLLERHRVLFGRWRAAVAELTDRVEHAEERAREADMLRHGLAEIDAVAPEPGEDGALRVEGDRLGNADALRLAASDAHRALAGDPAAAESGVDVAVLVSAARQAMQSAAELDETLAALAGRIDEIGYLVADLAVELSGYGESLDADPGRLAQVHDRRAALTALVRRYGGIDAEQVPADPEQRRSGVDAVLGWAERAGERLTVIDPVTSDLDALRAAAEALRDELATVSGTLSAARLAAGREFADAVSVELTGLAMPHARLEVCVERREPSGADIAVEVDGRPAVVGPDGIDEVEIRLQPHPGSPSVPLRSGASGGELSRVMLAIEVVLAGAGGTPTMVFDEVDAGVGGRAALEVGRRLARLARTHQVLVVTHLPQVAAYADRHLVVGKDDRGAITTSTVRAVEAEDRVRELARMLAGRDASESGRAHAGELLDTAQAERAG